MTPCPTPNFHTRTEEFTMNRSISFCAAMLVLLAASTLAAAKSPTVIIKVEGAGLKPHLDGKSPFRGQRPTVDVALLLDTSNSMDGLIHQAKSQLWTILHQFATAPCTKGPVDYKPACKLASERGMVVNTIHCGNSEEGRRGMWQDGAKLAEGESFNID